MGWFAAVDLHGDNGYYGIIDETGRRMFEKRLPNDLATVLSALDPYRAKLTNGIVVESTYNWYWLVDGLMNADYTVQLANPAATEQYSGLKNTDDKTDTFFLADLQRLGILRTGYIYPQVERPIRDILRRRSLLVRHRTAHLLSYQAMTQRQQGENISATEILKLRPEDITAIYEDENLQLMGKTTLETIRFLTRQIRALERGAERQCRLKPEYEKLLTVAGIGRILALTIMLETGPISRFASASHYSSYSRCVRSECTSNGKKKGENNRKNGNRYLAWAYIEAAHFCCRYCPEGKRWYQKKAAKSGKIIAIKALASKLSKACYYIMRNQVDFDVKKIFG